MPGVLEKFLYGKWFCDEIMPPSCICMVPTQPPTYTEKTGSSMQGYLVPMRSLLRRQRTTSKIRSIDVRILRRLMHFRDSRMPLKNRRPLETLNSQNTREIFHYLLAKFDKALKYETVLKLSVKTR